MEHYDIMMPPSSNLKNAFGAECQFPFTKNIYQFTITSESAAWCLGIRLFEDPLFAISDAGPSAEDQEGKTIMLRSGASFADGLTNLHLTEDPANQPLIQLKKYDPNVDAKIQLQYVPDKHGLFISLFSGQIRPVYKFIAIPDTLRFIQFFAPYEYNQSVLSGHLVVKNKSEVDDSDDAFRIGPITFRLGDMFDHTVIAQSNYLLMPASSQGMATEQILTRAAEIGIPPPPPNSPGTIIDYSITPSASPMNAGYAYSVNNDSSSIEIITNICQALAGIIAERTSINGVNLPLFGTGVGEIDELNVANVYLKTLKAKRLSGRIFVSIQRREVFLRIKHFYSDTYYALPLEHFPGKPKIIEVFERQIGKELKPSDYKVGPSGDVISLLLIGHKIPAGTFLEGFKFLQSLTLTDSFIPDLEFLTKLTSLRALFISGKRLINEKIISLLTRLTTLDISNCGISDLAFLSELKNLVTLHARNNAITEISVLHGLKNLEKIDLANNSISNISPLANLKSVRYLNLRNNQVTDIRYLSEYKMLTSLILSNNEIGDLKTLLKLNSLSYLKADKNRFIFNRELILEENENHITAVRNFYLRMEEDDKITITLPAKVLLIGNHAAGKSSLLHFMLEENLASTLESTHIIKIVQYLKGGNKNPEAIFFDFGGQDYYHGIYRAFMSGGSIYAVLWNTYSDSNNTRIDSRGITTQDYTLNYWLWQKKYLEKEKFNGANDPIILVQSHADNDNRVVYNNELQEHRIENEFFVSLAVTDRPNHVNEFALKYLRAYLLDIIEKSKISRNEPRWFGDFIEYIFFKSTHSGYESTDLVDLLPFYKRDDESSLILLGDDLDQLHKQGLVLYYKDDIPDKVWLNPVRLVEYIHDEVLRTELITKATSGEIEQEVFKNIDPEIITLLLRQKVLFFHAHTQRYIVPGFLPLVSDDRTEFELLTFGLERPLLVLKFKNFLPFGLINQAICFFGELPDLKKFWRDQLLFTINGDAKILIKIDFQLLEIKIYASLKKAAKPELENDLIRYLFYATLGLYWDLDLLQFNDFQQYISKELKPENFDINHPLTNKIWNVQNFYENDACRPLDLYISLDDKIYIHYKDLCSSIDKVTIKTYKLDEERNITNEVKEMPIFPYQPFTQQKLKRQRKAVISYSKKDLTQVNKFRQYLVPLAAAGLLEDPWYCTELIAGTEWNDEIQRQFNSADIIFFIVSENLLSTQYVRDHEIKNAIDRWDRDQSIKIVPILLVPYQWTNPNPYNLGRFSALPYTGMPVTSFPDQRLAWDFITQALRIMIEQDLYPGSDHYTLNNDMQELTEKIMNWRTNPAAT